MYFTDPNRTPVKINSEHCTQFNCNLCPVDEQWLPTSCPYATLHLLNDGGYLLQQRPRRSGKTTAIIKEAAREALSGRTEHTYVISPYVHGSNIAADMFGCLPGIPLKFNRRTSSVYFAKNGVDCVRFMSLGVAMNNVRGCPYGVYFTDDINPNGLKNLQTLWPMSRFQFHGGYYT